ncbi:MAG: putative toxin-antitoxin system toxin component, PIN family [Planctomycetes bacterium]|nr:putative toxin-antitoxin system toxin component, PIN family [Planctomycetota bacterium]
MIWRVVFDTKVVISALLWRGVSHSLLLEMRHRPILLFSSRFLLDELAAVLSRRKFDPVFEMRKMSRQEIIRQYTALTRLVSPVRVPDIVKDDPADNQVLACALAADANTIVSGDQHLLSLGACTGIEIFSAGGFFAELRARH